MNIITITVESLGATLEGAERQDRQAIKGTQCGWRWSPTLEAWYLPRNLRRQTIIDRVNTTYQRLTDAGYSVSMVVEEAADAAERREYRAESKKRRIEKNETKARKMMAEAATQFDKSRSAVENIPLGQPVMPGKTGRRHQAALGRSREALARGSEALEAAHAAAAAAQRGREDLDNMNKVHNIVDLDLLQVGDYVERRGEWYPIIRINRKSVTIPHIMGELAAVGHTWTCKLGEIQAVRRNNVVIWR